MVQRRDPIRVVPYDAAWPDLFRREATRLEAALAPYATGPVEHMGSTSVPGLAAKPIIDMLVPIRSYDHGPDITVALRAVDWVAAPEPDDDDMRRLSFCFPDPGYRTHHLHAIEASSPRWRPWLAFRDALRRDPEAVREYARLKEQLARDYANDRDSYRAGKGAFVAAVLQGELRGPA